MTRGDRWLLAGLVSLALVLGAVLYGRLRLAPAGGGGAKKAVVTVRGEVLSRIELAPGERCLFVVKGRAGDATVEADGGRIRMREAHCPGGICVGQGWIGRPGESIVCVPGEILIRIEGSAPLDAVTR